VVKAFPDNDLLTKFLYDVNRQPSATPLEQSEGVVGGGGGGDGKEGRGEMGEKMDGEKGNTRSTSLDLC